MSTLAAVAKSDNRDATRAGGDVARAALAELDRRADLFLVFATAGYDQAALIAASPTSAATRRSPAARARA